LHHTPVAKNATTCLFVSHLGYIHTLLVILAVSTLIIFPKGGMPAQRIAFFRAAEKQIYIH